VVTSLAFGQGIALIATCMNATAFTLAHTFDVQTQVSVVLLCSQANDSSVPARSYTRPRLLAFSTLLGVHIHVISFAYRSVTRPPCNVPAAGTPATK
jgi:hypothetical protein